MHSQEASETDFMMQNVTHIHTESEELGIELQQPVPRLLVKETMNSAIVLCPQVVFHEPAIQCVCVCVCACVQRCRVDAKSGGTLAPSSPYYATPLVCTTG